MRTFIRLSDFRQLNAEEQSEALRAIALSARGAPNHELVRLDARIRSFEARYEMTSEQMRARVAEGTQPETSDIASWLIALDVKARLGRR